MISATKNQADSVADSGVTVNTVNPAPSQPIPSQQRNSAEAASESARDSWPDC